MGVRGRSPCISAPASRRSPLAPPGPAAAMIVPIAVTVAGGSPIPAALAVHGLQGVTCTSWTSTTTVLSDERPVFRRSSQPASAGLLARRPPLQRWYSEPTPVFVLSISSPFQRASSSGLQPSTVCRSTAPVPSPRRTSDRSPLKRAGGHRARGCGGAPLTTPEGVAYKRASLLMQAEGGTHDDGRAGRRARPQSHENKSDGVLACPGTLLIGASTTRGTRLSATTDFPQKQSPPSVVER